MFQTRVQYQMWLEGSRYEMRFPTSGLHRRFLARHPDAGMYAGFKDFAFYRVAVERAHLVAGFGKIDGRECAVWLIRQLARIRVRTADG